MMHVPFLSLFATLSLRHLRRRWVRASLIVASITLGVALLVATQALNRTTSAAALNAANPIGGLADLLVTNGDAPVDRDLAADLQKHVPGVKAARPRVFAHVKLPALKDRQAAILGLDLLAEAGQDDPRWQIELEKGTEGRMLFARSPVILGKLLAESLGASTGPLDVVSLDGKTVTPMTRVGWMSASGPATMLGGSVLLTDLTTAAAAAGLRPGKVSRIDVTFQPGADRAAATDEIRRRVAGRAEVRTPEEQNATVQNVTAGMEVGLQLSGISALVVGLFLVYNALAVSVAERRHDIGILLSVGATRRQIQRLFAGEAALLGLVGSSLGVPLGVGMAHLFLEPFQETLNDVFFSLQADRLLVGPWVIAGALAAGVLTAMVAALVPAWQASRENPIDAVRNIPAPVTRARLLLQAATSLGVFGLGAALVALRQHFPPRVGMYTGLGFLVLGCLLSAPWITAILARLIRPLARRFLGLEGRLAVENLALAPGRTGLVIAALAAGVGMVTQIAGVIKSNQDSLRAWVQEAVPADLVVTSGSPVSSGLRNLPMDESLARRIQAELPAAVEAILPVRMRRQLYRDPRSSLGDTQIFLIAMSGREYFEVDRKRPVPLANVELYRRMSQDPDAAVVSENFAVLHNVRAGDTLTLTSPGGPVRLKVIGEVADYTWSHGTLLLNRELYRKFWDDDRVDVFDLYLKPGADAKAAQETLLRRLGAEHSLVVLTRGELMDRIDEVIEQFYSIAIAQQVLVIVVAALGVVTALLISVLQRRRELGLLRAVGASRAQVLRSVLAEAALMGMFGTVIGLLIGLPMQWFSVRIIFVEETGYVFPVVMPWAAAAWVSLAAVVSATLAGLGPALNAARQPIAEAVTLD